jgi:hypothetical protein
MKIRIVGAVAITIALISISRPLALIAQARTVTSQDLAQLNSRIASAVRSGVVSDPTMHTTLTVRRDLLKNILRNDPASARSYALDDSTRSTILSADPSFAALLEQDAVITGELVASVADDFQSRTSTTRYTLHTVDRNLDLSFAKAVPGIDHMQHNIVTVRGISLDDIMAAESLVQATPIEAAKCATARDAAVRPLSSASNAAPAICSTTGPQRIAIILVTFPNNTPAFPPGMDQAAFWDNGFFGSDPSLSGFLNEVSYGQTSATGDVYGPFALTQSYDCNSTGPMEAAAFAAAAGTVDFTQYNRYVIAFPATSCPFLGLATIGCQSADSTVNHQYSVTWEAVLTSFTTNDSYWQISAHEFGHNLGLNHANSLDFGSLALGPLDFVASNPGTISGDSAPPSSAQADISPGPITAVNTEYGDAFSVMGVDGPYSAEHRAKLLGWIPRTDMLDINSPGTYSLAPAENSSGLRALHVLRDPTAASWIWLEFHQPTGYYTPEDMSVEAGNTLTVGAQIHYEDGFLDSLHTYLVDMTPGSNSDSFLDFEDSTLAPGDSWSDPYSLLTITVGSQTSSSLGITVNYDVPCASLSLSVSELSAAGGNANLTITAPSTCSWSVSSNASWISFPGATSGTGNAIVPFTYTANSTTEQRDSYITAERQSLPVVQDGPNITILGVTPNVGSGSSESFVVTASDALGASDFGSISFWVGNCQLVATLEGPGRPTYLFLFSTGSSTTLTAGSPGSVSSSDCTLYGLGSSAVYVGDRVILTINLSFASSFAGTHPVEISANTIGNNQVGPFPFGVFTVNTSPAAVTPVILPTGGAFASVQSVTISDSTPGATIYYTTDGSGPTTNSIQYSGAFTVSQSETINALASAPSYSQSLVATAAYIINLPATGTPAFSPAGGTFTAAQIVTITDPTVGATIYYTTDGTTPTTSSTQYTGAITVSTTETLKAIAVATDYSPSAVAIASYTITVGTPVASLSETTVYFGAAPLAGVSGTMTITLTNNGNVPLVLSGDPIITSPFTILDKTCTSGSSITVGSSCKVDMTLTPASAGRIVGTLTFTDNASPITQTVTLNGAGLQPFHEFDSDPPVPTDFDADLPISPGCSSAYYGCAITSTASVLTTLDPTVTPVLLDAFLIGDTIDPGYKQYTDETPPNYCNLNWAAIPSFESSHSGGAVHLQMIDADPETNQTIKGYLTSHLVQNQVVIIQLHYVASDGNSGTHYIATLGPTDSTDSDWYIVDPGWPSTAITCPSGSSTCFSTLSGHLNAAGFTLNLAKGAVNITFNVTRAITYASTGTTGALVTSADSPVELLVTDPQGRQLGYLTNGSDVFNIPTGSYFVEYPIANDAGTGAALGDPSGAKIAYIPSPASGTYNLTVTGTASGPYNLRFEGVATNGSAQSTTMQGTAFSGSISQYLISYSSTPGVPFTVTPFATPTVTVTPSPSTITTAQGLTVTVTLTGTPVPTGLVTVANGSYTSSAMALTGGVATINVPAGSLAVGSDTLTASYTPDSASSSTYSSATGTAQVTVTAAVNPSFAVSGTAVTVAPGATTGNTSTITVTPAGGFTGSVALTAAITSSPTGAQYPPTVSFGSTTPVSIAGAAAGTATLTVSTTAPTSASVVYPKRPGVPWYAASGASLACLMLLGIPARRRRWRTMLGLLVLLAFLAGGVLSCGGGGGSGGGGGGGNPGTTAGAYTVTVTGTSGSLTQTTTLTVTVN